MVPINFSKCKIIFFLACPKTSIRFLFECVVGLLKGNLRSIKNYQVTKFQKKFSCYLWRAQKPKKRRSRIPKKVTNKKISTPPIISHLVWYGAVWSRPCFCVQKSLTTQLITKQDLSKYEAQQNPTYQNGSLEKEINQKFFAKADSLVDKILSYPRIKFTDS